LDQKQFLQTVITAPEGYFCLAFGGNGHGWVEEFYYWPKDIDFIIARAQEISPETNVYFSTYLFEEKRSLKQYVLRSKTIQADLDNAEVYDLTLPPSILVRTSENRHQGYWILKDEHALDTEVHEVLSKKLTYSIPLCDKSGWPLGRKVRFPGTLNHKYFEGKQLVEIANTDLKKYSATDLELLPEVTLVETTQYGEEYIDDTPNITDLAAQLNIGPQQLLETIKDRIPAKVYIQYNDESDDRSSALWALMCSAFRAGLNRDQVFFLAWHSANNKFKYLHHHADRELAKDVVRAELESKNTSKDVRQLIAEIKKLKATRQEKNQYIFNTVINQMKNDGEFIRTTEEEGFYIRKDIGRPIAIAHRSQYLNSLMYMQYGINGADDEHRYLVHGLNAWTDSLPSTGIAASLSHYDGDIMLVHTGKKDVLRITANEVSHATNGAYGILFRWLPGVDPFNPILDTKEDWSELLFGDAVTGVVGLTQEQAKCILRTWILFLMFKDVAVSKPILALFGQPGSGKTTMWRRIYRWLYGEGREINVVTNPDDFDQAMKTHPLVVLDNVDTWASWLPDRIATSAGKADVTKRKLYTDADDYIMRKQAILGLSAHNPKFGREDITDRLLLLNFERLNYWKPEGDILKHIVHKRNHIWGGIVNDIQKILATPMPNYQDAPQFRVEDFARLGHWIATALGYTEDFVSAIARIRASQKSFNLDEDFVLVDSIQRFLNKSDHIGEFLTAGQLWTYLAAYSDEKSFNRIYRNATHLGKKMWVLQDSLKEVYSIEWKLNSQGVRLWKIEKL
jgi:hypothetical protein